MDIPWQGPAIVAALFTAIAGALYWFGVIPWWGILIAPPLGALAIFVLFLVAMFFFTDWSH